MTRYHMTTDGWKRYDDRRVPHLDTLGLEELTQRIEALERQVADHERRLAALERRLRQQALKVRAGG